MPDDAILQAQIDNTIEPNVRDDLDASFGLLHWIASSGQIIAPWWSKERDRQLRNFWKNSDHLSSAFWMIATKLTSIPFQVMPRDDSVKTHIAHADQFNITLHEEIQFGEGWSEFWFPFLLDLWTQDNGAFAEVIGGGKPDGPIKGPAVGLRHLDSWRCHRTSNPEYPVKYHSTDGRYYKLHHSRVMFVSQFPDAAAEMYRVGHCWETRAINKCQELIDISTYKQEKLGSRPARQIILGRGMSMAELRGALRLANEDMDNQNLTRFSKSALLASKNPDFGIESVSLSNVPDGFDERTSTDLGMYLFALAGGFPPRWIWPASTTGATKADAMYQHISGSGGGASYHINLMTRLLAGSPRGARHSRGKFLPPYLKLVFDYQDDEADRLQSEIRKSRADYREKNVNTGSTTVRINRQQMVESGEISGAQFDEMELEDGRLPDGQDVISLFLSEDPVYLDLLDLGVENPLLTIANDAEEMLVAIEAAAIDAMYVQTNAPNRKIAEQAERALAALGKLKEAYEPLVADMMQQEMDNEAAAAAGQEPGGQPKPGNEEETETEEKPQPDQENPPEEETPPSPDEVKDVLEATYLLKETLPDVTLEQAYDILDKSFNFGAKMGQVIRGNLARGTGGRFMNASELAAARSAIQQRIVDRLRAAMGRKRSTVDTTMSEERSRRQERLQGLIAALRAKRDGGGKTGGSAKKPAKPKKTGGGGGKGGKSEEDKKREAEKKRLEAEEKKRQKRAEIATRREETLASIGLDPADTKALHAFLSAGKGFDTDGNPIEQEEPDAETTSRLLSQGLLQYDEAGQLSSTGAARSLLAAAKSGDTQRAKEAVARAKRLHQSKVDRISDRTERADAEAADRADMQAELDGLDSSFESDTADIDADTAEKTGNIDTRLSEQQSAWDKDKATLETRLESLKKDPRANADQIAATEDQIREGERRMRENKQKADDRKAEIEQRAEDRKQKLQDRLEDRRERLQDRLASSQDKEDNLRAEADRLARQIGYEATEETPGKGASLVKSADSFRGSIRSAIRGLWSGSFDLFGFTDTMISAISRHLTDAWNEGAQSCGIAPDELTSQETSARDAFVNGQMLYVMDFGSDIAASGQIHADDPRDPAGALGPLLSRGETWALRWQEAFTKGKAMACADKKLKWTLGASEHCSSCLKLADKVKRASYWNERGVLPRQAGATYLECGGWKCQCTLEETSDPQSKGPLPGLP